MDSSDDEQIAVKKTSNKRVLLDSDESDDDHALNKDDHNSDDGASVQNNDDNTEILASSDDGDNSNEANVSKSKHKRTVAAFADSDDSDDDPVASNTSQTLFKNKDLYDAEDASDDNEESKKVSKKKPSRSSSRSSSGSRSEGDVNENEEIAKIEAAAKKSKIKPIKRQDRKSKAAAMQEIYSESARIFRASGVQLQYHRPKQRTLDEFLNRKKESGLDQILGNDLKSRHGPKDPLEAERILEQCEKATEEFYKNDIAVEIEDDEDTPIMSELPVDIDATSEDMISSQNEEAINNDSGIVPNASNVATTDESVSNSDEDSQKAAAAVEPAKLNAAMDVDDQPQILAGELLNTEVDSTEEHSLKLFLDPDSEKFVEEDDDITISSDIIASSQHADIEKTVCQVTTPVLSKKLEALGKEFDLTDLQEKLARKPTLAKGFKVTGDIILEEGDEAREMDDFVKRFAKHAKANCALPAIKGSKNNTDVITIVRKEVDAQGVEQLKKETINYKVDLSHVSKDKNVIGRPGAQLIELKKTLKQKIVEKRRLEREQRKQQQKEDNEEQEDGFADVEDEEEELLDDEQEEEEDDDDDSSEGESEPPEEDEDAYAKTDRKTNFKRVKSSFLDDEAVDEDDDNAAEDDEEDTMKLALDDDEDDEVEEGIEKEESEFATPSLASNGGSRTVSKTGGDDPETPFSNMISSGSEAGPRWTPFDERDDDAPPVDTQNVRKKLGFESLFDTSDPQVSDMDDVIGLCSGQFLTQKPLIADSQDEPDSQVLEEPDSQQIIIQDTPDTVLLTQNRNRDESQILSQTDFPPSLSTPRLETQNSRTIVSSDDDDDDDSNNTISQKKLKKKTKKVKRLVLSDDESDDEEAVENSDDEDKEVAKSDTAADDAKEVMYDSEENEIQDAPQFKGFVGRKGIRKEFLENEAVISGSDEGSDDEDERGLDRLMMEEGDLDDLDEDQVRDEVGRLHHRQVLDEDKREIRLFQEAFLEDGELHSDNARARQFRWKSMDDENIDLSLRKSDSEGEEEANEQEEKRRIDRLDREKWLQESESSKQKKDDEEEEEGMNAEEAGSESSDGKFFSLASKAMKKMEVRRSISHEPQSSLNKVFKSPKTKNPLQCLSGNQRGSFLSRCSGTLEKLAEMTKGKSESRMGATAKQSNKFVFTAISPSKIEGGDVTSTENNRPMKTKTKASHKSGPPAKKTRKDRTLDESSQNTIFGLME